MLVAKKPERKGPVVPAKKVMAMTMDILAVRCSGEVMDDT